MAFFTADLVVRNLILFTIALSPVRARALECPRFFSQIAGDLLDTKPGRILHRAIAKTGRLDSIHVTEKSTGQFGHQSHTVEVKAGRNWGDLDRYPPGYNDIVLDPREIISALGPEAAAKFGYQMKDGKLIIPGPDELNAAIRSFNESLPAGDSRRIALSFYSTEEKITTGREYFKKYTADRKLPMARSGHLLLHDTSAHMGAAFIPPKIFDVSAERIDAGAELLQWIKAKAPSLARKTDTQARLVERSLVAAVDAGTNDLQNTVFSQLARKSGDRPFERGGGRLTNGHDDIGIVTTVDVVREYGAMLAAKLNSSQKKELAAQIDSYVQHLVAENPAAAALPYGLDRNEIVQSMSVEAQKNELSVKWAIHDAIRDREKELIRQHTDRLNEAFERWTPRPR